MYIILLIGFYKNQLWITYGGKPIKIMAFILRKGKCSAVVIKLLQGEIAFKNTDLTSNGNSCEREKEKEKERERERERERETISLRQTNILHNWILTCSERDKTK